MIINFQNQMIILFINQIYKNILEWVSAFLCIKKAPLFLRELYISINVYPNAIITYPYSRD